MQLVVSLILLPTVLATLIILTYKSYKSKNMTEMMPLLAFLINSLFVWAGLACYAVGGFNNDINGGYFLNDD